MDHRDKFSCDINLLTTKMLLLPAGLNLASRQYLCEKAIYLVRRGSNAHGGQKGGGHMGVSWREARGRQKGKGHSVKG